MTVPTPIQGLQATAGFGYVRCTFDPPKDWRSQGVISYTATVKLAASPYTVQAVAINTPVAGGIDPVAEFSFGRLTNGVPVTVTVVATNSSGDSAPTVSSAVTPTLMPGQIPNVITSIFGEIAWMYANLILTPCPRLRFGKKYTPETRDAPYVHLIPGRAEIEGPSHLGSGAPGSPLQLWTKRQHVKAECWGYKQPTSDPSQDYIASYGVAEDLMNVVAAAIHQQTYGSELVYSDEFSPIEDNETRGVGLSLDFSLFLPITQVPVPSSMVATIDSFDQSDTISR